MTTERPGLSLDAAIGHATISAVGSLTAAQLLSAITPERIGELTGYSASSIRYRLNGASGASLGQPAPTARSRGWSFNREQLLACAVDAYRTHARALRERARDRYLAALTGLAEGEGSELEAALEAEVADFASGESERLYLLALAGCGESANVARLLRQVEHDRRLVNHDLDEQALRLLGREPAPGIPPGGVAEAVNHYLHGLSIRRTFEAEAGAGVVLRAVLGLVLALTVPAETPPPAPVSSLLQALALSH